MARAPRLKITKLPGVWGPPQVEDPSAAGGNFFENKQCFITFLYKILRIGTAENRVCDKVDFEQLLNILQFLQEILEAEKSERRARRG